MHQLKHKNRFGHYEGDVTPEEVYLNRRQLLRHMGFGAIGGGALASGLLPGASEALAATPYPAVRSEAYEAGRGLTPERISKNYNNYFEFGSHKEIAALAQGLDIDGWTVEIDGLVERPLKLDMDQLVKRMELEERVYRHRCVEAWAMTVPWSGFALKDLVAMVRPLSGARYVRLEGFKRPSQASGQNQFWYPWPYVEGLSMAEAQNELAFIATGIYGKPLAKQFGAPVRLVTPWKYGFKSIKGITKISFVEERPVSFWQEIAGDEYGFWANVNPKVPHPRWSQASERLLGSGERVPTKLFNGYGKYVAHLYKHMEGEALYR
ncbi:protein-methionine-sulfoxide reductase catalytic subunit MsrP [Polycladidibacter hongkongensis]|uniref:protein-methionine-sulfoxide reductase catalytic subunit MsrP n=1 Tax=Polycladidibacter hongkongensis TaxID=1647556 RepID=UPI0008366CF4|nr:protein-methionine-sulfoxide reductase catalytic subunit MsrP [Pseudovibrio hongkongensis]